MKRFHRVLCLVVVIVALAGLTSMSLAQDIAPIEPLVLAGEPVIVDYSLGAAGPPTIEPLTDGRMAFRIAGAGSVTGDLEGEMTARISEVTAMPSPPFHGVSVQFSIETELGQIEGYYAGSLYLPDGADQAAINAAGRILSVSGAYADLYLADVYVTSTVQFVDGRSVGETGSMTIAAR